MKIFFSSKCSGLLSETTFSVNRKTSYSLLLSSLQTITHKVAHFLKVSPLPFALAGHSRAGDPKPPGPGRVAAAWPSHCPLVETLFLLGSSHGFGPHATHLCDCLFAQCLCCLAWLACTGLNSDIWSGKLCKLQFLTLKRICFHDETTFCFIFHYQSIDHYLLPSSIFNFPLQLYTQT